LFVLANPMAASFAGTLIAGVLFAVNGLFQIFTGIGANDRSSKFLG
jgi:uncharacterized membrane protein HdeD (DUF308 family)